MTIAVVVPLVLDVDASSVERARNWSWLAGRYAALHPEWRVVASADPGGGAFSKARAVNAGVETADAEVVVVADADVVIARVALIEAVDAAQSGASWVVPFGDVYRLSADQTRQVVENEAETLTPSDVPHSWLDPQRPQYRGKPGGGIVVLSADAFRSVGGFDERFARWGGEDFALAHALTACIGKPVRFGYPLWHLWHPPQADYDPGGRLPEANRRLLAVYRRASRDAGTMRALLHERLGGEMPCGCGGTTPDQAAAPRTEARCITCGRSFTAFDGVDGAEAHRAEFGHVIEGYRGLRASTRRSTPVLDPFAASNTPTVEPKMPTDAAELDPAALTP